ncbi:efflux RND transporter periplasmic adaptor subunit [Botrimarina hoheduenensis]|uniref:Putative efflux pump periplasmic linker TtgA n=1 Tax=Botrimarina hoheduenensis TaxID=2528000 RepID=A0A5C5W9M7_9BACT|nr:efflux RND transporter periplasmic adaptor subunit [Botrimarina hoheduenensis]TWT46721.1 putative efflux pump periplasmic linker TtgA precursor [Botrimarina hoheduenensis]
MTGKGLWRGGILLPLFLWGCGGTADRPGNTGGPPAPKVTVANPLVKQALDWDSYTGRLAAIEEVSVQSRVSGYLISHHFQEGQLVERGQLLFVIDPRPYEAALAQATATADEATAVRSQAESQVRQAEAKKQQSLAQLELAEAQARRARPLVPSGAISEDEYDVLVSAVRQSQADQYAADAEIESARAAVTAAEAAIATAEAAVRAAQLDREYCQILAPISGRIGRRQVTEGNLIAGGLGAATLTTIVSIDPIHADLDANEKALMKYIRLDRSEQRTSSREAKTPVYMALVDEDDYPHQGYIDFVNNRVDRATGTIRARAIFPNPDDILTPGLFVRIQVPGGAPYNAVLIPDEAIATDQASKFVFVVGDDGLAKVRPIKPGRMIRGLRAVLEGLRPEDRVVINGMQRCRPGAPVESVPGEIPLGPDDGLPDSYVPVPPEQWLQKPVNAAAVQGAPQ